MRQAANLDLDAHAAIIMRQADRTIPPSIAMHWPLT
jgi:hypothetical protein